MDNKDVGWLAGLSIGVWLWPTIGLAAEPPNVTTSAQDQATQPPPNSTVADKPLIEEAWPHVESIVEPISIVEPTNTESIQPDPPTVAEVPTIDRPLARPSEKAHSAKAHSPETNPIAAATPTPVPQADSVRSVPRLYGEPAVEPEQVATAPLSDPLEQLSTEEWLNLLSEPDDSADAAPDPVRPESPALRQSTLSSSPPSNSRPVPVSASVQDRSTSTTISRSAADLRLDPVAGRQPPSGAVKPGTYSSERDRIDPVDPDHFAALPPQSDQPLAQWPEPPIPASPSEFSRQSASQVPQLSPVDTSTIDPVLGTDAMAQVTSVSQLSDVQPTDWAYQALQSLVERYGVIEGYPDGLFRGDRALTRYEFAAGVNAAMDRLAQLIASSTENAVSKSDLDALNRLQNDFSGELLGLQARVDDLESRIAELDANQFSTTVVLNGQVTFGLADAWGGEPPGLGEVNPVLAYLAQLQLSGSFSERDAFRINFDAGNFANGGFAQPQALNTQMAFVGFQTDTDNFLEVSGAEYRFAVGDRLVITLKPVGFGLDSVLSPNSIYTSVSESALSRFAAENPIFRIGSLDTGVGADLLVTDRLRLQVAYGARNAADPLQGLFSSNHRALGVQLLARPFGAFSTGLTYVNAFAEDGFLDTFTGSNNADTSGGFEEPASINAVGGTFQWQVVPSVIVGAWGSLMITDSLESDAAAVSSTYLFSLGFPDTFGRDGDLLGIMVGQPPRLRFGYLTEPEDDGSGLHYEIFYRIRVNDYISITPGVFVVTDPGHISDNNTIIVGAIRTSFSF